MHFSVPLRLRRIIAFTFVLTTIFILPVMVAGQADQGRIVGTVADAQGGIVPGASVLIKNERTGEERTATTNEQGYYIVTALKPSLYSVTASAQNLKVTLTNVQLLVGQELNLPLTLQATGVEAKVDVVAAGDTALDTGSASIARRTAES